MTDDWIGIILPTKDGKYVMAKATIVDEDIESLKEAVISVSDVEGKKSDLKYPFVLLKDIDILRKKLIRDITDCLIDNFRTMDDDRIMEKDTERIIKLINRRFGGWMMIGT